MSLSLYLQARILSLVANGSYASLHIGDPGRTGADEIAGVSYRRQVVEFGQPADGSIRNASPLTFEGMPARTIRYIGLFDAALAGNFLWGVELLSARTTAEGDTFRIRAGDLTFSLGEEVS